MVLLRDNLSLEGAGHKKVMPHDICRKWMSSTLFTLFTSGYFHLHMELLSIAHPH
jgi:hypothetical protein